MWRNLRLEIQRNSVRTHPVFINFLQAWRLKRKIMFVRFFPEALRHICVTAEA
jgi:hypothetical protein